METVATVPDSQSPGSQVDRRDDTRPLLGKDVVVVVGPSGAGKRGAIGILEDLFGYSAVTKVTLEQLVPLVDAMPTNQLVFHVSLSGGETLLENGYTSWLDECVQSFGALRRRCRRFRILFLYCVQEELAQPHRQTVGFHPFAGFCGTLKAAIFKECEMLVQLFCHLAADPTLGSHIGFIDTSGLLLSDLKASIEEQMIPRSEPEPTHRPESFFTRGWNEMRNTLAEVERQHARFLEDSRHPAQKARDTISGRLNCLLLGETGVGKELIAMYLAGGETQMVRLNCEGIPRELLESELWGHVKGAYTHALRDRHGLVSQAAGKTLFVDEIGFADLVVQQKLLQFIETRRYKRLGSDKQEAAVDCRIIAATSRNLEQDMRDGRFLPDLYYRIAGVTITVPPLRRRREDIPVLLDRFLKDACLKRLSPEALAILFDHSWGGNVRLLGNTVEQCRQLSGTIQAQDLPSQITRAYAGLHEYHDRMNVRFWPSRAQPSTSNDTYQDHLKGAVLAGQERQRRDSAMKAILLESLTANNWNVTQAAEELKRNRSTIYRDMKRWGIQRPRKVGGRHKKRE